MTLLHPAPERVYKSDNSTGRQLGVVEWFRIGEHARVEQALFDFQVLGVEHLRTGISWADWHTEQGQEWYDWLVPRLAHTVEVLPCFLHTPPSSGIVAKTSSPPRVPRDYADFLDVMLTRYGRFFEWIELWNEPNNLSEWDWTLDQDWLLFSEMVGAAAYWTKQRGWKTVLGGMSPVDPNWLALMHRRGLLQYIDVIGLHGFLDKHGFSWTCWQETVRPVRDTLSRFNLDIPIWFSETGVSTWPHREMAQVREFALAIDAPVERIYWYGLDDLDPELPTVDGFHQDERDYHFGLKYPTGEPKLLFRLCAAGGLNAAREITQIADAGVHITGADRVLITGGAGFIGSNLADRLAQEGHDVLIYDNLSRSGVEKNLRWLKRTHPAAIQAQIADIRDSRALREAVRDTCAVFHLAAQTAVTTSLVDPTTDYEVNVGGTVNLLNLIRTTPSPPLVVLTSTNKVYGGLPDVTLRCTQSRYEPEDHRIRANGIDESRPLDFHSPYGCSKGAADQYVIDHTRTFGIPTVVFRMSCIYGPHQCGCEDQGWVCHFLMQALADESITIYGDGRQVRDILYIDDLVRAFHLAWHHIGSLSGQAFNIGGGPVNTLSLVELLALIRSLQGWESQTLFSDWRPGDQRYYVSDTSRFHRATGWMPQVNAADGVTRLHQWLLENTSFYACRGRSAAA